MVVAFRSWNRAVAVIVLVGTAALASADGPQPLPASISGVGPRTVDQIEVVSGVTKQPKSKPAIEVPPVTAAAHTVREPAPAATTSAASGVWDLGLPKIVVVPISMPAAANTSPSEPPSPRPEPTPNVVVIREPAAPPVPTDSHSLGFVVLGVGGFVFGCGLVATAVLFRNAIGRPPQPVDPVVTVAPPPAPPVVPAEEPVTRTPHATINGLDAGPLPELAEPFDLGPSYAEHREQQQAAEEAQASALVQNILEQNLALMAEVAPVQPGHVGPRVG